MKKIILSVVVVVAIIGYVIFAQRSSTPSAPPVTTSSSDIPPDNTNQPAPAPTPTPTTQSGYKDGSYTSPVTDAVYGNLQIKATISGGKITDVAFLQYPTQPEHSQEVSNQATPILKQEAISTQSANVDIVSGATQTSQAFIVAMKAVLAMAQ